MRKLLLAGAVAVLIGLPSAATADPAEPVIESDPTAEEGAASTVTTTKALHADGRGTFRFSGSGGLVVHARGVVRVRDDSTGDDLATTASGFGAATTSKDGAWRRYAGDGMLVLDGSDLTIAIAGRFTVDVDPTAAHPAAGVARAAGAGETILEGGVPMPLWTSRRLVLGTGPMAVNLSGRGAREWRSHPGRRGARVATRRVVITRTVEDGRGRVRHRSVRVSRWWSWDARAAGATWRLNGPAAGTVDIATVTGRVRVWDRSAADDLAVTVPKGTTTTRLADGSVVYSGLRSARVAISGSAFRMKVRAVDLEGVFTPAPGTLARAFARGGGTIDAGAATDLRPGRGGMRLLLQPAGAPA